ncbi:hypothetical protein N657DRAFT_452843 [Parathielavia appendiculata]|uniref:Uncharacterized protein n=1 Tax=Parathielavia appendiculata TaxID=2587402 RepID=A0AAN6Z3Z6_9PEZI|nr:hypothetical protein N657DRAFT_452843 [Parathielavia appendiculata]
MSTTASNKLLAVNACCRSPAQVFAALQSSPVGPSVIYALLCQNRADEHRQQQLLRRVDSPLTPFVCFAKPRDRGMTTQCCSDPLRPKDLKLLQL